MKSKILVIVGPTALGKTELALAMAKKFNGELITCDSRQVYKGLNIGAGKGDEKVRLYDVADPKGQFSVARYVREAGKAIKEVLREENLPIIVGGTGLYLRGLLGDIETIKIPPDKGLRRRLEKLPVGELQRKVAELSPTAFSEMNDSDRKNKRRLVRKIELLSMNPYIYNRSNKKDKVPKYEVLKIGLTTSRPVINSRIDQRLLLRLNQGMVDEARKLHREGLSFKRMKELGLEYGVMARYLEGEISYEQMVEELKNKIHQYAKRQLVWFRKDKDISWFDIGDRLYKSKVVRAIKQWYDPGSNA